MQQQERSESKQYQWGKIESRERKSSNIREGLCTTDADTDTHVTEGGGIHTSHIRTNTQTPHTPRPETETDHHMIWQ